MGWRWLVGVMVLSGSAAAGWAAQQAPPSATTATELVITLATDETIPAQSRFQASPPTIVISFPARRLLASLPERSVIQHGVVQEIHAAYGLSSSQPAASRWLRSLSIRLRGRYRYTLRSEPGRIRIAIEHPDTVTGEAIEVGLLGDIVTAGALTPRLSERFLAMQRALLQAQIPPSPDEAQREHPLPAVERARSAPSSRESGTPSAETPRRGASSPSPNVPPESELPLTTWWWVLIGIGLIGGASRGWRLMQSRRWSWALTRLPSRRPAFPAAVQLIDQLVWQTFERQGYQLVHTVELGQPLGLMRVIIRDGQKASLLCVGNGAFFEKSVVEQFVRAMRSAHVDQGLLVAPGAFTVPAQRYAVSQHVSLIGRDQLVELIGTAAMTASYTTQLEQLTQQLTEAKGTIAQYGEQLALLRRQRNEASWYLGEERVKSSQLESRLNELTQQVQQWQTQAAQTATAAEAAKKQWEESQWYLGEARAALEHLQGEIQGLRQSFEELNVQHRQTLEALTAMQGERDESLRVLEDTKRLHDALAQQTRQLEERVQQVRVELEAEQARRTTLEEELKMLRHYGERRTSPRISPAEFNVELQDYGGSPIYRGGVRDVSLKGFSVETPVSLECPPTLPVRARLMWKGRNEPLESEARIVWQQQHAATQRYQQGFELEKPLPSWAELPPATRPRPSRRPARQRVPRTTTRSDRSTAASPASSS